MAPDPMQHPRPWLRVGVVGAGRVGAVLGAALASAGHRVVAVSAVSEASRERAELLLPDVPVLPVEEVVAAGTSSCSPCPTTPSPVSSPVSRPPGSGARADRRPHLGSARHRPFAPATQMGVVPSPCTRR